MSMQSGQPENCNNIFVHALNFKIMKSKQQTKEYHETIMEGAVNAAKMLAR